MMNGCGLVDGLGWGGWDWEWGVWCWDSVGRAVDVPTQRYSTYPHLSPPNPIQHQIFPTYPDRIRTARHTPLSPPSRNSHPQYLPYIHPTQLHSRSNSTPTNPIRPYPLSSVHYPTPRYTLPPPNQTPSHTSTQPICPTIATPQIIAPSKPSPLLPLYAHPAATTLISPSKAHMSLWRFSCALTIEYKCRTSNINKRL